MIFLFVGDKHCCIGGDYFFRLICYVVGNSFLLRANIEQAHFLGPHILEAFGNQTSTGIALEFNVHTFSLNVRHSTLVFDRLPGFRKSVFEIGAV
jgi:hypothetical protein